MVCAVDPHSDWWGRDPLVEFESGLSELHGVARTPVTARVTWWQAAADADPSATPALFVRTTRVGELDAAALLMIRTAPDGSTQWLTSARPGTDDAWEIASRSPRARRALAEELADEIGNLDGPWTLELNGVCERDGAVDVLTEQLPNAKLIPAAPVPRVTFGAQRNSVAFLRASVRDGLIRSARRIARDGLREEVSFTRDVASLLSMQPEIEATHRARDHDSGRLSDLDDDAGLGFWRSTYRYHATRGELEVATLRLDGELAAYVVAFTDTPAYRVFDGRFEPAYRRYSPGRRLEAAVLERAFGDPSLRVLDWMSSVAPDRLLAATDSEPRWTLVAGSASAPSRVLKLAATVS
jgi:Acetyltransferase (GNAT) domain